MTDYITEAKNFILCLYSGPKGFPGQMLHEDVVCKVDRTVGTGKEVVLRLSALAARMTEEMDSVRIRFDLCCLEQTGLKIASVVGHYQLRSARGKAAGHSFVETDISFFDGRITKVNLMQKDRHEARRTGRTPGNDTRVIADRDIEYVDVRSNYVRYHCCDGSTVIERGPLSEKTATLPESFLQIGRGCLVNMDKVERVLSKEKKIVLPNGSVPVPEWHFSEIRSIIEDWGRMRRGAF